jgi:peptidoglycan/xylan/chitin deacetylase (PgdA/CDA1 family)
LLSKKVNVILVSFSLLLMSAFSVLNVSAATHGSISIVFDDGWQSQYDYAFPLLQSHGMKATFYINPARVSSPFMTVSELQTLQNYGHEIGSHGNNHLDLPTLTDSQMRQELQVSQQTLRSWGLTANNYAYPDGARNAYTDSIVSQYYHSARSWGVGPYLMQVPTSQFLLPGYNATVGSAALTNLKSMVDQVYSANGWAIICFHNIAPDPGYWQPNTSNVVFGSFLDYIQAKGVTVITVNQGLSYSSSPSPTPSPTGGSATFGLTSIGGFSTTFYSGVPRAVQYTPTGSGTVTDIMLYITSGGSGGHAQVAIYSDSGGKPGALLAKSSSDAVNLNGWHDFFGFNTAVTGGTAYWLAFEADNANLVFYYNNGGANYYQGTGPWSAYPYGTFPNPYVTLYYGSYSPSIYAIYRSN